ncbi:MULTISPECIES: 5-(carboxyamino)imidazole ribonucleotide synthase [unclassified Methylophaga]|jgi:5-(carboxyamino)imidazole ribonucleotide synthase|uniref:5-(carboxyamino)imidazole ribonucleotide synthase n=1 Tax=unclassified Methylophaga TaxID=2629249 RepID=UPI000C93D622|nr:MULTISPECIES: 5-(carboxyamino)imidazole ribonucleotide synthase [unclassified Methylophaga]MAP27504.1 5-(carboxyamino)imidazole ribonucleotide synthase [Methylophaga sp.]HBX60419.1 5-(carboxyamino)imidazole ribonucleotide synthase [Methylophaga sp.]|tara:strand:+ start:3343 stop:4473 length:1131 start_codon:yes stop_codon:yes gene_type:complete
MILPGATLGMLGGGQLGRMFTTAAQTMGYKVIVLDPDKNSPAGIIADQHICSAYTDEAALTELAQHCAAITTEFENIPASTLAFLEKRTVVHPSSSALASTQNRNTEKNFIRAQGIATVPFVRITHRDDFADISTQIKFPAILKVATFGYDGKGQIVCEDLQAAYEAFEALGQKECVLEQRIDLEREISVVLARGEDGQITAFPVAENVHINGILHSTTVPSAAAETQQHAAIEMASKIADGLDYVGTMAVEFFVSKQGEIIANEIAPRPHNSGHYTLDACRTSQFEQQVRMLCGLPAGSSKLISPVVMINLLGDVWGNSQPGWDKLLNKPDIKLHLYGKREARAGRKMGHFNVLADTPELAMQSANMVFDDIKAD